MFARRKYNENTTFHIFYVTIHYTVYNNIYKTFTAVYKICVFLYDFEKYSY